MISPAQASICVIDELWKKLPWTNHQFGPSGEELILDKNHQFSLSDDENRDDKDDEKVQIQISSPLK